MFYPEGAEEFSPGFQPWEPSSKAIRPEAEEAREMQDQKD
jgi:hypothetical protein